MNYEPNWHPPTNEPAFEICFKIAMEALRMATEQMPDLIDLFPFRNAFSGRIHFDEGWLAVIMEFDNRPGIPSIHGLNNSEINMFKSVCAHGPIVNYEKLLIGSGPEFNSPTKFSYVGPWKDQKLSLQHLGENIVSWINTLVLPEVLKLNRARVLRAIPQPPQYSFGYIRKTLWVLECDETFRQGTAFFLKGVGLVTCSHVLGPKTYAFRADNYRSKYAISIVAQDSAIDLAILGIEVEPENALHASTADGLKQMDHLAICGYPNYRFGDSGTLVPGFVVGFRTVSGIRRILTNAPIIAGSSGSPVLGTNNDVIGVAVTGADRMEDSDKTENHSIIPIDAVKILQRRNG